MALSRRLYSVVVRRTFSLSVGPSRLQAGDRLGAGLLNGCLADHLQAVGVPDQTVIRVLPGPHPEWFASSALDDLAATAMTIDGSSNRVGVRLDGIVDRKPGELPSLGVVTGAVQVPPDGRPVVLGPDHATLGGYPVVAVVITADRWKLGQCRPGDRVWLRPVTMAEAMTARASFGRLLAAAVVGRYPTIAG